jgi:flagellar motor switch protein FliM
LKEVLTQFQIDELLQDIIGGQVEISNDEDLKNQKKIKEYDFKIPKKFTKEQLRTIVGVYDIYARHLSSYLTGTLRTFCQLDVISIEETKYYEYSNSLPDSVLIAVLDMLPFEGTILMEISRDLSFVIMDKMLGGTGDPGSVNREYTDIELVLMERLYKNLIAYLKDAWSNVADVQPEFRKFEMSNGTNRIMHLDEIVVIIVLEVKIKEITGNITICIPYVWLEPINEKLYTRYRMTERIRKDIDTEASRKSILSQIYHSQIELTAILGNASVNLRDVLNMEVGDVIKLRQKVDSKVKMNAGNKTWFYAQLGTKKRIKAVQILKSAERGEANGST